VLKSLPQGGIETWLMHVLRRDRNSFVQHELLLMVEEPAAYEPEARALGIPIHKLPKSGSWARWLIGLRRFLKTRPQFDIVHSHVAYAISAPILAVAAVSGVKIRIAHQHEARSLGIDFSKPHERVVRSSAMGLYRLAATHRVGITEPAIKEIAGTDWRRQNNCSILLYGFDYANFSGAAERARDLSQSLQLERGARVIGHVGRFDQVKNHAFLLRTFAKVAGRDTEARLVMVGRGGLQPKMRRLAGELGIAHLVHFAGSTHDVAAYMAMFDLFVFPSFSEGLGIVCIEAQAAGTRVIASDTVPREAAVVPGGLDFLPLAIGEDAWANRIVDMLALPSPDPCEWRRAVEQSAFGLDRCIRDLHGIYREQLKLRA
jgi:glycosyltransferase involved in cell wall biosynthesis